MMSHNNTAKNRRATRLGLIAAPVFAFRFSSSPRRAFGFCNRRVF